MEFEGHKDSLLPTSKLPLRFKSIPPEFPDRQPDRLGGVLIESDKNRKQLVKELAETIKNGTHILIILGDVDGLKHFNDTFSRDLGDEAIKHSIFTIAKEVDKFFPQDSGLKIRIFRDSQAADETWLYILGLTEKQLNLLGELKRRISNKPEVSLPNRIGRGISFSVGFCHSGENRYEELLMETKLTLENNRLILPFDFFNQLRKDASEEADEIKIGKILKTLSKVNRQKDLEKFIEKAVEEFGGSRLPPKVLKNLLEGTVKRSNKDNSYG